MPPIGNAEVERIELTEGNPMTQARRLTASSRATE